MATQTALDHPRAALQGENHFRYRVSFGSRKTGAFIVDEGLSDRLFAYEPSMGSETPMFTAEGKSLDRGLVRGWYPSIRPKMRAIVTWPDGTTRREFEVQDAMPGDSGPTTTMLTITPV